MSAFFFFHFLIFLAIVMVEELMMIYLRPLQKEESEAVYNLLQAIPADEKGFDNPAHGLTKAEFSRFLDTNIKYATGVGLDNGYLSHTIYVFFVDDVPVGISKIRTYSDQSLLKRGGHIGCCIAPCYRGKGYGSALMKQTIEQAHQAGLKDILLGCYTSNIPSCKMIERNGGILEEPATDISWYWIKKL